MRFIDTKFKVGSLYLINDKYYVCSKSNGYSHRTYFREFPSMRGVYIIFSTLSEVIHICDNVPFSRKSVKGRERVDKWLQQHPEYLI